MTLPTHTSCRPMMALTSGALKTCVRDLETHKPSCIGRSARLFFMLEAHGPQGTAGCVVASEPSRLGGRVRSCRTCGGARALPCRVVRFGATVHVVTPEPSLAGERGLVPTLAKRQGPVMLDTWQCVEACLALCLDLKLVCRGTQFAGYR
jgi:hypothetical protein